MSACVTLWAWTTADVKMAMIGSMTMKKMKNSSNKIAPISLWLVPILCNLVPFVLRRDCYIVATEKRSCQCQWQLVSFANKEIESGSVI